MNQLVKLQDKHIFLKEISLPIVEEKDYLQGRDLIKKNYIGNISSPNGLLCTIRIAEICLPSKQMRRVQVSHGALRFFSSLSRQ